MSSLADDVATAIIARWSTAFGKLDAAALSSLYSNNAFFFGSKSRLFRGTDGVAEYFNTLPRWAAPAVRFSDMTTAQVNPGLINFAATATFTVERGAEPLSVKITWVIAREDGGWKIVSHHVSSQTPLLSDPPASA